MNAPLPIKKVEWNHLHQRIQIRLRGTYGDVMQWDHGEVFVWICSIADESHKLAEARTYFAADAIHVFERMVREAALVRRESVVSAASADTHS